VTGLPTEGHRYSCHIYCSRKRFLSTSKHPDQLWEPRHEFNGYRGRFPRE